jgi:CubicO group peptidase (beta-lactamase class C family)
MSVDSEFLRSFLDANYTSVSPGINILVKSNNFEFEYWNGAIKELGFNYTRNTIYDLASLTKPIVTATLAMKLLENGMLSLEDSLGTVGLYPQELSVSKITVGDLLRHRSGLKSTYPVYNFGRSREDYLRTISLLYGHENVNIREEYSDLNYILLGFLIEKITGDSLSDLASKLIFSPLNMLSTGFNPDQNKANIAPTEIDHNRGGLVWGKVHDELSYYLGGIAGNAGLFSNTSDLAKYVEALLSYQILEKATFKKMISPENEKIGGVFSLGWMTRVKSLPLQANEIEYSNFMGDLAPIGSFGHTGFTGTSLCIDPDAGTYVIILSNRVYPSRNNPSIFSFRKRFHNLVFSLLSSSD